MLELGQVIPTPLCGGWTKIAQPEKRIAEREKSLSFHEKQCSREHACNVRRKKR
jgi:hypothetical protein